MYVRTEIDQSWKIENTDKSSYFALATSNFCYTVELPSSVKRKLQELFRIANKPKLFIYRTFAACLFLLIKKHLKNITILVIDVEYPGHEALIKDMLLEMIRKHQLKEPTIYFEKIGKSSKAHKLAYKCFKGERQVDKILNLKETERLAIKKDRASRNAGPRII